MNLNTQRRCLGMIAGSLLVGAAGAVAWSLSSIAPADSVSTIRPDRSERNPQANEADDRPPSDALASKLLRAPLYDPPAQPRRAPPVVPRSVPKRVKSPPLDVTLVGTIIQSNERLAILTDASGKFDIKGVGESLELEPEGMTVQDIESEQVTLRLNDRQSVVVLDRSTTKQKRANAGGERGGNRRRNNR